MMIVYVTKWLCTDSGETPKKSDAFPCFGKKSFVSYSPKFKTFQRADCNQAWLICDLLNNEDILWSVWDFKKFGESSRYNLSAALRRKAKQSQPAFPF